MGGGGMGGRGEQGGVVLLVSNIPDEVSLGISRAHSLLFWRVFVSNATNLRNNCTAILSIKLQRHHCTIILTAAALDFNRTSWTSLDFLDFIGLLPHISGIASQIKELYCFCGYPTAGLRVSGPKCFERRLNWLWFSFNSIWPVLLVNVISAASM